MENKKDWGLISAWLLLIFGLIAIFIPYYRWDGIEIFGGQLQTKKYDELAQFIGGITAPFLSISAFILLYLTYKSQKIELKESRNLLSQQTTSIEKQQFESTFFNLLNQHNEILKSIDIRKIERRHIAGGTIGNNREIDKITIYGRDCFKFFYTRFLGNYSYHRVYGDKYLERINWAYNDFFKEYQNDVGHYFRFLYNIIKFVDQSTISDKKNYTNIVRAQLSSHELLMLFYNSLSEGYGHERFKPLIEKYQLLKNMPFGELIKPSHRGLYKESAYSVK